MTILMPRKGPRTRRSARDPSQELLQNLGSQAADPPVLRDLRHDIVEGLCGPHDVTEPKVEDEIQLATILVRRSSVAVRSGSTVIVIVSVTCVLPSSRRGVSGSIKVPLRAQAIRPLLASLPWARIARPHVTR